MPVFWGFRFALAYSVGLLSDMEAAKVIILAIYAHVNSVSAAGANIKNSKPSITRLKSCAIDSTTKFHAPMIHC